MSMIYGGCTHIYEFSSFKYYTHTFVGSVCARRVANGHFFHSKSEGESSGGDGERAEVAQAAASVTPLRALSCARAPPKLEGESSC